MTFKTRSEAENVSQMEISRTCSVVLRVQSWWKLSKELAFIRFCFALQAANQGAKFKGRVLQISWYKPKTPSVTTEPEEEEAKDDDNTVWHVTLALHVQHGFTRYH